MLCYQGGINSPSFALTTFFGLSACRYSDILEYHQDTGAYSAGVADVSYATLKYNDTSGRNVFLAVFDSASDGIGGVQLSGSNGAGNIGASSFGELGASDSNPIYSGWYKRMVAPNYPSINHILIAPGTSWNHTFDNNTDGGLFVFEQVRRSVLCFML